MAYPVWHRIDWLIFAISETNCQMYKSAAHIVHNNWNIQRYCMLKYLLFETVGSYAYGRELINYYNYSV